jgi:hypothetical protein
MRRVLSLEIGIEKPYFKPGAALRETKNVPRVLILQEALMIINNLRARFGQLRIVHSLRAQYGMAAWEAAAGHGPAPQRQSARVGSHTRGKMKNIGPLHEETHPGG